jgi:RNA polymerase sigma-70 factor, ECF subfamily
VRGDGRHDGGVEGPGSDDAGRRSTPGRATEGGPTGGSVGLTLVPAAESADADGLRAAYLAHGGELFGHARRSLGDTGLAEEAVQETFIRAWRARDRFDPSLGTMRSWLFAIERRIVIDLARSRALRTTVPMPAEISIPDDVEDAMVSWQVEEAVRRLRPEHREVLIEVYYRGRRSRDVAEELSIPEGTVRSRLFYALRAMRLILDEMGWEP